MNDSIWTTLALGLLVCFIVFMLMRELMCWYFKINETLAVLKDVRDLLAKQGSTMNSSLTLLQKQDALQYDRLGKAYLIDSIVPNGSASVAGLKEGDVLIEYNGHQVTSDRDISAAVEAAIGPTTRLTVIRDVECLTFTISAGRMGIDGHQHDLDARTHSIRMTHVAGSSSRESVCPGCGTRVTAEDSFCEHCGAKIR